MLSYFRGKFMEIIADLVVELLGKLLRQLTKNIKNAKVQTFVDILIASVCILIADGCAIWGAVSCYRQGKILAAIAFASVVVISLLLIGFIILRHILRNKKKS